jgi:hypothetical protein
MEQLYGDVILAGSVYGAVETKPHHENPPVHNKSAMKIINSFKSVANQSSGPEMEP